MKKIQKNRKRENPKKQKKEKFKKNIEKKIQKKQKKEKSKKNRKGKNPKKQKNQKLKNEEKKRKKKLFSVVLDKICVFCLYPIPDSQQYVKRGSCRRSILSGLLCLFSFLGVGPICNEFRIWASNLVLSLLFINFIESLSHFVLNLCFVWFSCLIVNYVVSHLIVLCFKYRFVNVLYRFVSCHFYFVKCHLILINRVF